MNQSIDWVCWLNKVIATDWLTVMKEEEMKIDTDARNIMTNFVVIWLIEIEHCIELNEELKA